MVYTLQSTVHTMWIVKDNQFPVKNMRTKLLNIPGVNHKLAITEN